MTAKPDIPTLLRYLALAFFSFFSIILTAQALDHQSRKISSSITLSGISSSRSEYYRNLMVQDIALPQQISLDNIQLEIDFTVEYQFVKLSDKSFELVIKPKSVSCRPIDYFGFDISSAVLPLNANIEFLLKNSFGFVEDSIMLKHVPFNIDSNLYITRTFTTELEDPYAEFSHLDFNFTEQAYEYFRQRITLLDDYYAAVSLMDSVLLWTGEYFPTGKASVWGNFLQQLEIQRILHYVEHSDFVTYIESSGKDPASLKSLLEKVNRKMIRARTIMERQVREDIDGVDSKSPGYWITSYYDWVAGYKTLSTGVEHRYGNYFDGLGHIDATNGMITHQAILIRSVLGKSEKGGFLSERLPLIIKSFAQKFISSGFLAEQSGNIVLASECYRNALAIRHSYAGFSTNDQLVARISQLRIELAQSYLNLSRMIASKGNISIAERYLNEAYEIFDEENSPAPLPDLERFEQQLYELYFQKALDLVGKADYKGALEIADYLQEKCSLGKYDCTGKLKELITQSSLGLYQQLLSRAGKRLEADEPEECRDFLQQAIDLRVHSVGIINRDKRELAITSKLDQLAYDDDIGEGKRYLNFGEYQVALYYFNRARNLESRGYIKADPGSGGYTRLAARPVIMDRIESGKVKAHGYYFEESLEIIDQCYAMARDYGLEQDSSLMATLDELKAMMKSSLCEKYELDYSALLQEAKNRQDQGNYINALSKVNSALEMLFNDTVCEISDQEAWYLRAFLEYPVEFEKREKLALGHIPDDPEAFVRSYQDLEKYWTSMDLARSGVQLVPMFETVLLQTDKGFLKAMMLSYINQGDKEKTIALLKRIWALYHEAPTKEQQKYIAGWMAREDFRNGCEDPMACMNECVPRDRAFRSFRYHYKLGMVKESGWKFRYLSLFLKSK